MKARFTKLKQLHAKLDATLRHEIARRAPDQLRIMALKRRKLLVKDLLARLAGRASDQPQRA